MKNRMYPMKKVGVICLTLIVAIGSLGVAYGYWSQNLDVAATVTTGAAPEVITNAATGKTSSGATLNGNLTGLGMGTAPTVYLYFEYGLTTSYTNTVAATPLSATSVPQAFTAAITGLTASTLYHFRAKAVGLFTAYGDDLTFTTSSSETTITLTPVADAYVYTDSASTNYGSVDNIRVLAGKQYSLVKFDLTPDESDIPAGATITSARMRIYVNGEGTVTSGGMADAFRITSSWTEAGVTYSTRPAYSGTATSSVTVAGAVGWTPWFDVKSDVLAFRAGTYNNDGWWLKDNLDTFGSGCWFRCWSKEYTGDTSLWPQLEITYIP